MIAIVEERRQTEDGSGFCLEINYNYFTDVFAINNCNEVDGTREFPCNKLSLIKAKKFPVESITSQSSQFSKLIFIDDNRLLLLFGDSKVDGLVNSYEGILSEDKTDLIWKEHRISEIKVDITLHMAFKIKKNVYFIGIKYMPNSKYDLRFGRYDLEEKMWFQWDPYLGKQGTDSYIDFTHATAIVNRNETFALIIAKKEKREYPFSNYNKVIVFTEENGFQKFPHLHGKYYLEYPGPGIICRDDYITIIEL